MLFCELTVAALPSIERHEGPPVHVGEHAEGFYGKYVDRADAAGPFVEDGRYVVERPRDVRTAAEFAEERLGTVALGKAVERLVERGAYEVAVDGDVAALAEEFGGQLAAYFDPRP